MSTVKVRNFVKFEKNTKMKSILKIVMVLVIFSCGNDKNSKQPVIENQEEQITASTYKIISEELLKNSELKSWDSNAKPTDWEINKDFERPEDYVIDRDTLDLLLKGHDKKNIFLKQTLNIEPNSFYVLSCKAETSLKSDSYAGLLIKHNNNIIGKRIFEKADEQIYNIVFNSLDGKNIECFFGYIEAGEGDIKIKEMTLKKIDMNNSVFDSEIAKEYQASLSLTIDSEENFDESVQKIIKHTSDLLLSEKRNDSININNALVIDKLLNEDSFLKKYFKIEEDKITKSYQTRLTYSAIDILDEFNIGTQRIELHKNNKRIHLLLNYFNPYSNKWITVDPFYNSKINIDNTENLSSVKAEQLTSLELGGLSNNIDGLIQKYSGTKAILKQETIMGYPF